MLFISYLQGDIFPSHPEKQQIQLLPRQLLPQFPVGYFHLVFYRIQGNSQFFSHFSVFHFLPDDQFQNNTALLRQLLHRLPDYGKYLSNVSHGAIFLRKLPVLPLPHPHRSPPKSAQNGTIPHNGSCILIGLHPSPRKTAQFLITGREQVIKSLFLPIFQIPNEYLFIVFVQIFVFHVYPFIRA